MLTSSLGAGVRYAWIERADGVGTAPYDRGNVADHVGDDLVNVSANRELLAGAIGLGASDVVAMSAAHGTDVAVVEEVRDPLTPVDAMVTTRTGVGLLVLAADCVPVLLADAGAGVIGVAHSGWRGTKDDVIGSVIASMSEFGADREGLRAVVGPSICGACYRVDALRYAAVVSAQPAASPPGVHDHLDLRAAVVAQLAEHGVRTRVLGGCTYESVRWFSHRRDGVTGRHGGLIALA